MVTQKYGFKLIDEKTQIQLAKPKKYKFDLKQISIPEKDFIDYGLEIRNVPHIYKNLVACSKKMDYNTILDNIITLQQSDDEEKNKDLPLIKTLKNHINKQTLISFRNDLEQEVINYMPDGPDKTKNMYKDYCDETLEDFLFIYEHSLPAKYFDFLNIISNIDNAINLNQYNLDFYKNCKYQNATKEILNSKADKLLQNRENLLQTELDELKNLDLKHYEYNFSKAKKIEKFSSYVKDYMKNPKDTSYQSIHMIIKTPFGVYEKQFRTEEQHHNAEFGIGSHENYKPHEKDFHRLKVCTPLMPKRDEYGEIISPIQLVPSNFDESIKIYFGNKFETYLGMPYNEFLTKYNNKEDFDNAMQRIGAPNDEMLKRVKQKLTRSKTSPKSLPTSTDNSDFHDDR